MTRDSGHSDLMLAFHEWVTGELGLVFDAANARWIDDALGLEVRVSVAHALLEQGRATELRANTIGVMQKRAALMGVRYGVPGVADPSFERPARPSARSGR